MNCAICKKSEDECTLVEGIFDGEITEVCTYCANKEQIPLIKKPTSEQLTAASEVNYSVRERMEKLSNPHRTVTRDQSITHKNLAKLKFPEKRQDHESLIQNYDWKIKTARRRKKFSIEQLSQLSGVSKKDIENLERGQLVPNLEPNIVRLEMALGDRFLKHHETRLKFTAPDKSNEEIEQEILHNVSEKIDESKSKKENIFKKIASGRFDFSKKENIENITLSDLAELKKQKEKNELFGTDDIEFEEELD